MPLYEYECTACGAVQERLYPREDRPRSIPCECGETAYLVVSAAAFILKGEGFYKPSAGDAKEG